MIVRWNLLIGSTRPIFAIFAYIGDGNKAEQVQEEPCLDVRPRYGLSIGEVTALRVNWHIEPNDYINGKE